MSRAVCTKNLIRVDDADEISYFAGMIALIRFVLAVLASLIKSKSRLEAENAALPWGRRPKLFTIRNHNPFSWRCPSSIVGGGAQEDD
jgi:hypothetical protein